MENQNIPEIGLIQGRDFLREKPGEYYNPIGVKQEDGTYKGDWIENIDLKTKLEKKQKSELLNSKKDEVILKLKTPLKLLFQTGSVQATIEVIGEEAKNELIKNIEDLEKLEAEIGE